MSRKQLVHSTLAHQQNSRVPYSVMLTGEGYDAYGSRLLADYADRKAAEDLAAGKISLQQAVSLSIGNHILHVTPPWWGWHNLPEHFIKGEDTPDTLPSAIGTGSYERFFELCDHIRRCYDVYILVTVWGSHWEKAYFSRGIENFLYDLAASPEWSQALLDMVIRKNLVMLENILSAGDFDGVLLGSDWGTQRGLIMSPACWRQMIKPGEQQEYDLIKSYGKHVWIHSCGDVQSLLPDLVDMGVDVLNPVQPECMNLSGLKLQYGDQLSFYGGISTQGVLPYGTPSDVRSETERTIALMSANGGYITSSSQEIQTDVPYENLKALIDTARKHGA